MSERLPYEEQLNQQWNELPLPDENTAWADMKRLLDEDDDDGIIVWWQSGCLLWGLLLLALLSAGWWLFRPEKWVTNKQHTETTGNKNIKENSTANKTSYWNDSISKTISQQENKIQDNATTDSIHIVKNSVRNNIQPGTKKYLIEKGDNAFESASGGYIKKKNKEIVSFKKEKIKKNNPDNTSAGSSITGSTTILKTDSVKKINIDSVLRKKEEPVAAEKQKKDSLKQKHISFSAGIAMQQQLPVNGQKWVTYNSLGRKGIWTDYIPSVFVRMYKNNKWFIQSEFRYGAPQNTKEFLYNKRIDSNQVTQKLTTTSTVLKKTFYHQLPLTFNYFVLPNWSVGTGVVWNKFKSAVAEQNAIERNLVTGIDTIITQGLIINPRKADSTFAKSYFQAVIETQYRRKRFSVGARYAFGLQPYIKFTLPGGTEQQEKNNSLQLFLRYELWKSKEK